MAGDEEVGSASNAEGQSSNSAAIFISYSSQDAAVANSIVESLEQRGINCWIAPRDVAPGSQYADEIVAAINNAKVFVLVLSEHAVASAHVGRELERAASKGRRVIVLRTDAAPLTRSFEYFLSESQWIDVAALGVPAALTKLTQAVELRLSPSSWVSPSLGVDVGGPGNRKSRPSHLTIKRTVTVAVLLVIGAVVVGVIARYTKHGGRQAQVVAAISDKSIAVLPFVDMSEKKDQEYFGDGMAEEILDLLAKISGLKVIGRTSSFQFKNKTDDLRRIGNTLGVAYLVEGSVRRVGDRIRVIAQLIDVQDGTHLWSETYDREVSDVLNVQAEIAASLARSLQIEVAHGGEQGVAIPVRTDAYVAYLQGLHSQSQFSRLGLEEAVSDFERALTLDPNLLRAREALADAHFLQYAFAFATPTAVIPELRREIEDIFRIDPNSVIGHGLLARILTSYDWDWSAAQREANLVLSLDPSSGLGLYATADLALVLGRDDDAEKLFRKVLSADPLDDDTRIELAFALSSAGRSAEAVDEARQVLARHPSYAAIHYEVGIMQLLNGQPQLALREMQLETAEGAREIGLAVAYHALRRHAESEAAMRVAERIAGDAFPFQLGGAYAYLGDSNAAFGWIEKAYAQRDYYLQYIKATPLAANLKDDPRYKAFLKKMNLPE